MKFDINAEQRANIKFLKKYAISREVSYFKLPRETQECLFFNCFYAMVKI
jgi:hypothetical protein